MLAVQALNDQSYAPFMQLLADYWMWQAKMVQPGQFAISGVG